MPDKTTSSQLVIKILQRTPESVEGQTPTASPTFVAIPAESLSHSISGGFSRIGQIGPEDALAIVQGPQTYESEVKFHLNDSAFLKYGLNTANYGTPAGTISETLSLLYSIYLNNTENYIFLKGSRAKNCSLSMEVGKTIEANIGFVHTSISTPSSSHGLTTPTFASVPSGAIWNWLDGGANPVSWNAAALNCKKFSISINRSTNPDHTLGNLDPYSSQPHARNITGSFTTLWTSTTLEADTSAAAGDLLKHNGTKFVRFAKGSAFQKLRTNSGATDIEWSADMFSELGRTELGANATSISVSSFSAKKHLTVICAFKILTAAATPRLEFNSDTGTNYSYATSRANAAEVTGTSAANIPITDTNTITNAQGILVFYIKNESDKRKMLQGWYVNDTDGGATAVPQHVDIAGKWDNASAQITTITLKITSGSGTFASGSKIIVLGGD